MLENSIGGVTSPGYFQRPDTSVGSGKVVTFTPERERAWIQYLRGLARSETLPSFMVEAAERLWNGIRATAGSSSVPDAAVTETGGIFMSWDRGDHHLEIELNPDGQYEWFYRNRRTGEYGGEGSYPAEFVAPFMLSQMMLVTR